MEIVLASGENRSQIYTYAPEKRANILQKAWLDLYSTRMLNENQWMALVDHSSHLGREGRIKAARQCARYGHDLVGVPGIKARVCRCCVQYQGA